MSSINETMDINATKNNLTRCKKNFTRYYNSAGRQTAFASQHPSNVATTEVRTSLERVNRSFGKLISTLDDLQLSPKSTEEDLVGYEDIKDATQQKYKQGYNSTHPHDHREHSNSFLGNCHSSQPSSHLSTRGHPHHRHAQTRQAHRRSQPHGILRLGHALVQFFNASRLDLLDLED